jgi:4-alpha-glucanotransferase
VVDAGRWGVATGYHDAAGRWREPGPATIDAILTAMGAADDRDPAASPPTITVRLDHELPLVGAGTLTCEDGSEVVVAGALPPDIPTGYHRLVSREGVTRRLIVSPGTCRQPEAARWGIAAQLYAARSAQSWGMGDIADLAHLTAWAAGQGAGTTLLNPLHAAPPGPSQQPSPYFASSRCFESPLYLRVEDVPGAAGLPDLESLAEAGRALNQDRLIDRDRVWALKSAALEGIFAAGEWDAELAAFRAKRGPALYGFATWNALAEVHGVPWQDWPEELRRPDTPAVARFATSREGKRRIGYHIWLQCQLDRQRAAVGGTPVIADLAIGVNAGGADAWLWQDTFAAGMRVGAPPDEFNGLGQDWGLPPWDPWRLRGAGYEPYIQTVRAGLRHAGGLRFDHVMGLFRLFWIPEGATPVEGTYVHYPYWDLLNILALEAERAGAFVVGEDLGTVEDHVRAELRSRRVLSYKLLWFEDQQPAHWDGGALGAITTHDLPTIAGVWSGSDLEAQRRLGFAVNEEASQGLRDRLAAWTGSAPDRDVEDVISDAYGLLAQAPCSVLTVSLDDLAAVEERPNMPGTVDEWPNWRLALPMPIEAVERSPLAQRVAARMRHDPNPEQEG